MHKLTSSIVVRQNRIVIQGPVGLTLQHQDKAFKKKPRNTYGQREVGPALNVRIGREGPRVGSECFRTVCAPWTPAVFAVSKGKTHN